MAGHLGHATGAGQQAQCHLGQAELNLVVVHRNAVVADQRHFPAAAQRGAIEAAHHRLAQGLDGAEVLLDAFNLGEDRPRVGWLQAHGAFQVGTGKEGGLG